MRSGLRYPQCNVITLELPPFDADQCASMNGPNILTENRRSVEAGQTAMTEPAMTEPVASAKLEKPSQVVSFPSPPPVDAHKRGFRQTLAECRAGAPGDWRCRRCMVALARVERGSLHDRACRTRRGHSRGDRNRNGQSGAHDHRRQLCVRRDPAALLRLQHPSQKGANLRQDRSAPLSDSRQPGQGRILRSPRRSWKKTRPTSPTQRSPASAMRSSSSSKSTSLRRGRQCEEPYDQAQAQIAFDQATIEQRQAELDAAQVNLDYTDIVSPVDGTVVSRNVTMGQTVAASFQTPTLFLIATDLTKMQVDTNVSESDIGGIKEGNTATFTVDAFPKRTFDGRRDPSPSVAADRAERRHLRRRGQRRQFRPGAQARHDGSDADRHRFPHRRHACAESGAALPARRGRRRGGPEAGRARSCTAAEAAEPGQSQVWVLRDGQPSSVPVTLGLEDDSFTEIVRGDLRPGDQVIVSEQRGASSGSSTVPRPRL